MRKCYLAVVISTLAVSGSMACASKTFVRRSVGATNDKVESMVDSLEEVQQRTGKNERRIADVDTKVQGVAETAYAANGAASKASAAAKAAGAKLAALDKANRRLVYDLALTADEANFAFGRAELPADARARIDGLISELAQDPKNVFIEIEGHTDNVGAPGVNAQVGLARAQAVQRYLYDQYQIPLHKMNVITFGEDRPAVSNATKAGRAQNRRVVIRIRA